MEKFTLTPDLIVGVETIDNQHKELIDRINKFLAKIESTDKATLSSELNMIFEYMIEYANFHFSEEEKIMEQHNCPILNLQKVQHQFFIIEANKLKFDLKSKGISSEIIQKSQNLLVEWLKSHISGMDKKIKNCIHKNEQQ
ncbi:MAG: bacteriohemerythrin [Brevinematales bacterium]|nr:bacteriohemerythrin [Brevinematales bacterium]